MAVNPIKFLSTMDMIYAVKKKTNNITKPKKKKHGRLSKYRMENTKNNW
jgi:hypothetical protein